MTEGLDAERFRAARARVAAAVHHTPMLSSRSLGERVGGRVALKAEHLQKTGSFKPRGALHRLLRLADEARLRGVVTVSAGNHAQALAWAAARAGVHATVVMPASASRAKAEASGAYGAEVVLHGEVHDAFRKALELAEDRGLIFVHPFDDPEIVAGAGSVGLEILEDVPDVASVVVPVGGGGLISGIATALAVHRPGIRVYGVEPVGAAAMHESLAAGRPVRLDSVDTLADGLAPPMAGELNYELVRRHVEDVVLVTDDEIVRALAFLLARTKQLVEPAGAAGVAALLTGKIPVPGSGTLVVVLSGGNLDLARLPELLVRAGAARPG